MESSSLRVHWMQSCSYSYSRWAQSWRVRDKGRWDCNKSRMRSRCFLHHKFGAARRTRGEIFCWRHRRTLIHLRNDNRSLHGSGDGVLGVGCLIVIWSIAIFLEGLLFFENCLKWMDQQFHCRLIARATIHRTWSCTYCCLCQGVRIRKRQRHCRIHRNLWWWWYFQRAIENIRG